MDAEAYRADARERWETAAAGWAQDRESFQRDAMEVSRWMLDAVDLQPGHTVLELAAGPGDTGLMAAELVEPGGKAIITDNADAMIEAARARAKEVGATNVEIRPMEAEWIDLPTASVDAVLCRWGYMLLADPEAGLRETRRVLRPGGRVALAAWTRPEENQWLSAASRALVERGLVEPPDPDEPGPFAWAQEGRIAETLHASGFEDVEVDTVEFAMRYRGGVDEWWQTTYDTSTRFHERVDALDDGTRGELRAELAERVSRHIGPDGALTLPARTWVAVAGA